METLETTVNSWRNFPAHEDSEIEERLRQRFIEDILIPQINNVFQIKFREIEKRHDLQTAQDERTFVVHYTSLDTLFSVLTNYSEDNKTFLRMYDSFHLNDPKEGYNIELNDYLDIQRSLKNNLLTPISHHLLFITRKTTRNSVMRTTSPIGLLTDGEARVVQYCSRWSTMDFAGFYTGETMRNAPWKNSRFRPYWSA